MEVKLSRTIVIPMVLLALLSINVFSVVSAAEPPNTLPIEPISTVRQPSRSVRGMNAPTTPPIQILQVYPNGHNTTVVAQAIYTWSTMFHIDVLPVTTFNACTSVTCSVTVLDPMTGATATRRIDYYDVLYFGVADAYGYYDLSASSASVVRDFARLGRGVVFTHDTVAKGVSGYPEMLHPNFASLVDVHGIGIVGDCSLLTFTRVKLVSDNTTDPVLNSPFRFPSSFDTLSTHWGCQTVVSGTAWYNGTDSSQTPDYHLYMQTYFNEDYGSHSAFYSYGHTEGAPMEWEAKAMINSMWFAYRGSGPALELPVEYASYTNFATAAQGNVGGKGPGRVNSWYDHSYPTYCDPPNGSGVYDNKGNCTWQNNNLTRWDGHVFAFTNSSPSRIGQSWYDGHNGIDFQRRLQNEPIYAAASGVVTKTVKNCVEGVKTCGNYLGNQVWIDHGMGYATAYGHLQTVSVTVGTQITDITLQPLGIMGNTGNSTGIHLHFGLYHDQNNNGQWVNNEAVDPYGWLGTDSDPWSATSVYLWKHSLWIQQSSGSSGGTVSSPSGNTYMIIPPGALTSTVTLELWDSPPIAEPSAQLRSTGRAFWLRVLEWLTGSSASHAMAATSAGFAKPFTVTLTYSDTEVLHLDENQLGVQHWSTNDNTWVPLATTVNASQRQVTAQTTDIGNFDLQAPLLCPADSYEPDDSYYAAVTIPANGTPVSRLFDIVQDEDWFRLEAVPGNKYVVQTTNLATDVDTVIEIYNLDGVTSLASDDNSGGDRASKLEWRPPQEGTYFIRVSRVPGSAYGCDATYQLAVTELQQIYLPLVARY